jgi:hypothetical protein
MTDRKDEELDLARLRKLLQDVDALSALSADELLELASQITEILRLAADVSKQKGFYRTAAALYEEIAAAWKNAGAVVPPQVRPHFESLAKYWQGRGEEVLDTPPPSEARPTVSATLLTPPRGTTYQGQDSDEVIKKFRGGAGDSQEISKSALDSFGTVKRRRAYKNSDWTKK